MKNKEDNKAFLQQYKLEVALKRQAENQGLLEHVARVQELQRAGKLLAAAMEISQRDKIVAARKEAITSPPVGTMIARGRNSQVQVLRETIWL